MCGIVGYVGDSQAAPLLMQGLSRLEYRGYDSAGIAVLNDGKIDVRKAEGRLINLGELTRDMRGTIGIGHTRWATHGAPEVKNAHPHVSKSGRFAIVHNGIIENYKELKKFLADRGFEFVSDTDSEVIAHLIDYYYAGDVLGALIKTACRLIGSYALGIICRDDDRLYAMRKDSPLVVGLCKDDTFIASDMQALIDKTRDFYIMDNGEIAVIGEKKEIFNLNGEPIKKKIYHAMWDKSVAQKQGYAHFMLKEIHEQPKAIKATLDAHMGEPLPFLSGINSIHIIGCGSAYHAALMGKYVIESLTGIRVNADIASEFRYRNPIIKSDDLLLAISQSGETADTIGALKIGAGKCKSACIVNVPESSMTQICTPMYTFAGPEVAVATTKGFTTQLVNLYIIAAELLKAKGDPHFAELKDELEKLPRLVTETLGSEQQMQQLGVRIASHDYAFFIGRGADFAAAKESALKLKEISYVHADCYPAGELKHGTISLIEQGSVVVAIATDKALLDKTVSNIIEVKARGAFVIGVSCFDVSHVCDVAVRVPRTKYVSPLLASVACQLLAYYTASARGADIDKPRNLAKSVTVE